MSIPLSNFLIEVSQNPALLHRLRENPEGVGEEAGLSSEELAAIFSGDEGEIYSLVASGVGPPTSLFIIEPTHVCSD